MKKVLSTVLASLMLLSATAMNVAAMGFSPSLQKLSYETGTYGLMRSVDYYYTDYGYITNGTTEKTCQGLQGVDESAGYVSANGWVTGLRGTHVETYIYGQTTTTQIDADDNRNCNMNSDCSSVHSSSGTINTATSVFFVNDSCPDRISNHSVKAAYDDWNDRIRYD